MTEAEIYREYKEAKDREKQIGILADLSGYSRNKIVAILKRHGARTPIAEEKRMEKRLEVLDRKIQEMEAEYAEIADAMTARPEEGRKGNE